MKYAFAGDREISCDILKFLIKKGNIPCALIINNGPNGTHSNELKAIADLEDHNVLDQHSFKGRRGIELLKGFKLDYIIGIHFPVIIPKEVLNIPKVGVLNLHPAYLPYNRGWHTPSWAILEKSIYGATLHFMCDKLDEGDIIHQKKIKIHITDTANTLYQRVLDLEKIVFEEAYDSLLTLNPPRKTQNNLGTSHTKSDLKNVQELDIDKKIRINEFIDLLRALSTNNIKESAYFLYDDKKISIQVILNEID
ncbi:formyltransferase family protein [Lentiprolixibacter aurantiacus]|uniref:phosphoribosylglycinamide formyltransferase 1 n=1 Tax=Lentiprolixibacter aurantiacus TaxID=2993939 RepID=A0AAE3MM32_9FLAO|nr:formyltransferase family protein [Lentiprolixibacter aurantiacus]MCX2719871.1 formyltransferase family protein [Lentiprolixibacter aurantiacus]